MEEEGKKVFEEALETSTIVSTEPVGGATSLSTLKRLGRQLLVARRTKLGDPKLLGHPKSMYYSQCFPPR